MKKLLILLLLCNGYLVLGQDNLSEGPFPQLIIRGVTLINGNGAPPRGPIDIVVENNKIVDIQVVGYPGVKIDESKRPQLKAGGKELDCEGMYLLPGFVDMHGHIGGVAQGADSDYVFKLWMAHGITTVREPAGRGIAWTLDLKRKSEKNEIIAPRIQAYTAFGQKTEDFNPLDNGPISTPE
ncbi:MAG: amidohydrolase, partial [Allomuricauda sp.]